MDSNDQAQPSQAAPGDNRDVFWSQTLMLPRTVSGAPPPTLLSPTGPLTQFPTQPEPKMVQTNFLMAGGIVQQVNVVVQYKDGGTQSVSLDPGSYPNMTVDFIYNMIPNEVTGANTVASPPMPVTDLRTNAQGTLTVKMMRS